MNDNRKPNKKKEKNKIEKENNIYILFSKNMSKAQKVVHLYIYIIDSF